MKPRQQPAQHVRAGASGAGIAPLRSAVPRTLPFAPPRLAIGKRAIAAGGALLLCLTLSGCRHRVLWTPPVSTLGPVPLDAPPDLLDASQLAELPSPDYIPQKDVVPPVPPRRRPTQPAREAAAPTPPVVPPENAALSLGSLSTGGDSAPQAQQQARDLIASIRKRVAALPRNIASQQKNPLRQVNSFLRQAQQALDSGDADGATTLATKARLIMDDIEKH